MPPRRVLCRALRLSCGVSVWRLCCICVSGRGYFDPPRDVINGFLIGLKGFPLSTAARLFSEDGMPDASPGLYAYTRRGRDRRPRHPASHRPSSARPPPPPTILAVLCVVFYYHVYTLITRITQNTKCHVLDTRERLLLTMRAPIAALLCAPRPHA